MSASISGNQSAYYGAFDFEDILRARTRDIVPGIQPPPSDKQPIFKNTPIEFNKIAINKMSLEELETTYFTRIDGFYGKYLALTTLTANGKHAEYIIRRYQELYCK